MHEYACRIGPAALSTRLVPVSTTRGDGASVEIVPRLAEHIDLDHRPFHGDRVLLELPGRAVAAQRCLDVFQLLLAEACRAQ